MNIFNLSFGKDSMATLILAYEQGIPIDRVMYCDIRFSPEISGEHPVMAKWIPTAEKRKPYRGAKAIDPMCRNHGGCPACAKKRQYKIKRREPLVNEE